MSGLCDLPPELLQRILSYVKPEDVLALRQCCNLLESLSRDREVWRQLLQKLCRDLRITIAYYLPWSLSSEELEAAACAHARFKSTLIRNGLQPSENGYPPLVKPSSISTFFPSCVSNENDHWLELKLFPGGRLLFALSHKGVELFDLRGVDGSQFKPLASASYTKEYDDGIVKCHFDRSPSEDGGPTIFALICEAYPAWLHPTVISVFEMSSLRESRPSLIRRSTLRLPGHNLMLLAVHSGRPILFCFGERSDGNSTHGIGLWDYESNRVVKWELDVSEAHVDLLNEYVVCVTRKDVRIFSIPALSEPQLVWGETITIPNHSPLKTIELAGLVEFPGRHCAFHPRFAIFNHQGPAVLHFHGFASASWDMVFTWASHEGHVTVHIIELVLSFKFSGASLETKLAIARSYETKDYRTDYGCGHFNFQLFPTPGGRRWTAAFPRPSNGEDSSKDEPLPAQKYMLDFEGGVPLRHLVGALDNVSGRVVRNAGNGLAVLDYQY